MNSLRASVSRPVEPSGRRSGDRTQECGALSCEDRQFKFAASRLLDQVKVAARGSHLPPPRAAPSFAARRAPTSRDPSKPRLHLPRHPSFPRASSGRAAPRARWDYLHCLAAWQSVDDAGVTTGPCRQSRGRRSSQSTRPCRPLRRLPRAPRPTQGDCPWPRGANRRRRRIRA